MIRLTGKVADIDAIACSGGIDSMSALHFLSQAKDITVIHFDHGTEHGAVAADFVQNFCRENNLVCEIEKCKNQKPPRDSWEDFWRRERYRFFHRLGMTIATVHHLNDVAETWLFGSIHGCPKLIPYRNKNVVRPFLLTKKIAFQDRCKRYNVPWVEDSSNKNCRYARNRIRNNIMPQVTKVNPGFLKTIFKKMKEKLDEAR